MSEITNKTTKNATIQQYVSNTEQTSSDEPVIDVNSLDGKLLQELVKELNENEIKSVIDTLIDEGNVLDTVQTVTSDKELSDNIDEIRSHFSKTPSVVQSAAESVTDALGMKPFELDVIEQDTELEGARIRVSIDSNIVLTKNAEVNAELFNYAARIKATTGSGQKRLFNRWSDALTKERISEFKRKHHPDALGFAIPEHVPATGDKPNRTPITEIPFIGEATAKDIHPTGDVMSIEDYVVLTPKQASLIEFPIDKTDYADRQTRGVAKGIIEHVPAETTDTLGKALEMMDRRDSDDELSWVNSAYTFGIAPNDRVHASVDLQNIKSVDSSGEHVVVEVNSGSSSVVEKQFSNEYWGLLELIANVSGSEVCAGTKVSDPAFVSLPDGGVVVCAPRVE